MQIGSTFLFFDSMRLPPFLPAVLAVFVSFGFSADLAAEEGQAARFPFIVSALDGAPAALDLSYLNEAPAGKHGFIQVKGEHLVDGAGKPWRYFGVNMVADACFPDKEDAPKLAAHFAKSGFNLVRFHFLDENWSELQLVRKDGKSGLNAEALDKLDFFFAELKKRGVYANLNLHVGRQYPDQPKGAPNASKGIDNIYPPYVEALKTYAFNLLTHVNPYTGLAYQKDPAVATVEVNNENTLMMNSFWPSKIQGPVRDSVQQKWTAWAARSCGYDFSKLQEKWGLQVENSANLVPNGNFTAEEAEWYLMNDGGAVSTQEPAQEGRGIRITATKAGTDTWHTQLMQAIPLEAGKTYRMSFRARADGPKTIYTTAQQNVAPFSLCGLWQQVSLDTQWQDFTYVFTAKDCEPGKVNLVLGTNGQLGWFEFSDVKLVNYHEGFLAADSTIERGLPIPDETANKAVLRDWFQFLSEEELAYTKEMHRFLKEDLGVKCPVSHSHIFFGALFGVRREALVSDIVNANAYWHHPEFTKGMWDPKHWVIKQEVLSRDPVGGVLSELAVQRAHGKPFAITEWDIPSPIDSLAEGLPLVAAFASYHDWAGLTLFAFAHTREDFRSDYFHSFFNYHGHPAKRAGIPFAALLFRTGLVSPGKERAIASVQYQTLLDDITENKGNIWSSWRRFYEKFDNDGSLALKRQTSFKFIEDGDTAKDTLVNSVSKNQPAVTEDGQLTWGTATKPATVVSPNALFAAGNLSKADLELGAFHLRARPVEGDGFAIWGVVPLDGKPLSESKKLLGLALRRSENEGMKWTEGRTSVGTDWGKGPSLVVGYEATVKLPGKGWKVSALDPGGIPVSVLEENTDVWKISPAAKTVWWLLER